MPIKPKRGYPRKIHQSRSQDAPVKYCENPACGTKLVREKARCGYKYCDRTCRWEHERAKARERRPKDIRCSFCQKPIDTMRAKPSDWQRSERHFCDEICAVAYRRKSGQYTQMSKRGNAAMQAYKEKHGHIAGYEDRAKITSKGNKERPPKAKHFTREGRVWGYDVKFYPHEDGQGYRVSIPELPELEALYSKTVKEGLILVREEILEMRSKEARGEIADE